MRQRTRVGGIDRGAKAQLRIVLGVLLTIPGCKFPRWSAVERNRNVRLQCVRRDPRAAQPDLFLNRKRGLQLDSLGRMLEKFRQNRHSKPIVQRFSAHRTANTTERRRERRHRSHFDLPLCLLPL